MARERAQSQLLKRLAAPLEIRDCGAPKMPLGRFG
jgi:hypothetical protein